MVGDDVDKGREGYGSPRRGEEQDRNDTSGEFIHKLRGGEGNEHRADSRQEER